MSTECQDFDTLGVEIKFKKEVGILTWRVSDCGELVGGRLRRLSDWWFHLRKHIGINSINYFLI